jgi:hypothetical protein
LARKQAPEAVREKPLLKQAERKLSRPRHKARSEMAFLEVPNVVHLTLMPRNANTA